MIGIHQRCPLVVVGEHRTSIAVTSHGFGREERCSGDVAKRARLAIANTSAKALGGIFKQIEPKTFGHFGNQMEVGGKSEQVNSNNGLRLQLAGFDCPLDFVDQVAHIHVERIGIDIHKDGSGALNGDHFGRSEEGEAGHEHGVASLHIPGFEGQQKRVGTAGATDAVFHSHIVGKGFFHLFHLGAHHVSA